MSELLPDDLKHTLPFNALPMTKEEREYAEMLELAKLLNIPESKLAAWIDTVPELIGNPDFPSHELFQKFHPSFRSIRTMEVRPQQPFHGLSLSELLDIASHLPGFQEDRQRWIASNPQTHKGIITDAQGYRTHTLEQPYMPHGSRVVHLNQAPQHAQVSHSSISKSKPNTGKSNTTLYPSSEKRQRDDAFQTQIGNVSTWVGVPEAIIDGAKKSGKAGQKLVESSKPVLNTIGKAFPKIASVTTNMKPLPTLQLPASAVNGLKATGQMAAKLNTLGTGLTIATPFVAAGIDIAHGKTYRTMSENFARNMFCAVATAATGLSAASRGGPLAGLVGGIGANLVCNAVIKAPPQNYNPPSKALPSSHPHSVTTGVGKPSVPYLTKLLKTSLRTYAPEEVQKTHQQLKKMGVKSSPTSKPHTSSKPLR
ncbi:MAG: hypothetical protein ACKO37_02925 [Vampirovibrionales bacterium]